MTPQGHEHEELEFEEHWNQEKVLSEIGKGLQDLWDLLLEKSADLNARNFSQEATYTSLLNLETRYLLRSFLTRESLQRPKVMGLPRLASLATST